MFSLLLSLLCVSAVILQSTGQDLFPDKFIPGYSKLFTIKYHNTYKNVTILGDGGVSNVFILTQRGQTPPSLPPAANVQYLDIPLNSTAVLSTTMLTWFELIGARSTVKAIEGGAYISSPCLLQGLANGAVVDVVEANGYSTNTTTLESANVQAVFCNPEFGGCPGVGGVNVPISDYLESSALAQAEYLGLVSAFYNAEFVASTLMTQVVLRSECNARLASDALTVTGSPKPRVMWAYLYFGAWHVGYCPDYYCVALSQAGGDMILSPIPDVNFQGINHTVMTSLIRNADVWLYASDNWDAEVAPSLPGRAAPNPPTESVAAVLAAAPAVANRTVYDFLRAGEDAWFEVREAEPDALLQDLVSLIHPEALTVLHGQYADGTGPNTVHRVFWRNVFTETAGTNAGLCTNYTAPATLYSMGCPAYPTSPYNPLPPPAAGTPVGAIVGGTVGGVAATALIVGLVVMGVRTRSQRKALSNMAVESSGTGSAMLEMTGVPALRGQGAPHLTKRPGLAVQSAVDQA